jgi:hypothetical protein
VGERGGEALKLAIASCGALRSCRRCCGCRWKSRLARRCGAAARAAPRHRAARPRRGGARVRGAELEQAGIEVRSPTSPRRWRCCCGSTPARSTPWSAT